MKDREARGQKVTLECWIAGRQKIVTTSAEEDLQAALNDVRDDLRRKLNDAKTRQEPRHNKHIRGMAQTVPAPLLDLDSEDDADPGRRRDRLTGRPSVSPRPRARRAVATPCVGIRKCRSGGVGGAAGRGLPSGRPAA